MPSRGSRKINKVDLMRMLNFLMQKEEIREERRKERIAREQKEEEDRKRKRERKNS